MNNHHKLLFSLLMLLFVKLMPLKYVLAEGPPRKLESEEHRSITFAHVNETITLKCPVESYSEFQMFVDWTKGNISLYSEKGYEITNKGFLKIKSVTKEQSGIYTCEAVNGYGFTRVNLTLVVINEEVQNDFTLPIYNSVKRIHSYPPVITKRPSSASGDIGGEATFHCISSGHPVPQIFWLKEGHLIEDATTYISNRKIHSTLKLKALKKSDAGEYKCIAKNIMGEDEEDYRLHVTDPSPPPKILSLDPPNVTVRQGETITFVCVVSSRPEVQLHIKWLKKQEDLYESPKSNDINLFRSGKQFYRALNLTDKDFITNNGVYKSKLFIRNSCEADSGIYVCLALNDKGYSFKNSTLKVIGTHNTLESSSGFPTSSTPLAVTITFGFLIILTAVLLVSNLCCKSKLKVKEKLSDKSIPMNESGTLKHNISSIRKSHKGDNAYPEVGDLPSTSKLLAIDPSILYDHSESQISKSAHTRTSFH